MVKFGLAADSKRERGCARAPSLEKRREASRDQQLHVSTYGSIGTLYNEAIVGPAAMLVGGKSCYVRGVRLIVGDLAMICAMMLYLS